MSLIINVVSGTKVTLINSSDAARDRDSVVVSSHAHTKAPLDIELMWQPHSSARHCDSVVVSSHADTASSSIELNDSDSVAVASDTLSSCRRTLTSHAQGTVHTATRVMLSPHAARDGDTVVVSSHAHTKSHSTSRSCGSHTAPLASATVSWCRHTQRLPQAASSSTTATPSLSPATHCHRVVAH